MRCCPQRKKPSHAEREYLPLDGGHGWAIVAGGALTHFVLIGMSRCLGIIFLALQTKFNTSAQETAWATALFNTTRTLIGKTFGFHSCILFSEAFLLIFSFVEKMVATEKNVDFHLDKMFTDLHEIKNNWTCIH